MVASASSPRLGELLDQVRVEFDSQTGRANEYEHQRTFRLAGAACRGGRTTPRPLPTARADR